MLYDPLADYLRANPLTQDEHEAIIILLIIMMYADKKLTLSENDQLRHYERVIPWTSERSFSDFFSNRIAEVRSAMRDQASLDVLINATCARILDDQAKNLVILACNDMAAADNERTQSETDIMSRIVLALESA